MNDLPYQSTFDDLKILQQKTPKAKLRQLKLLGNNPDFLINMGTNNTPCINMKQLEPSQTYEEVLTQNLQLPPIYG